jgi:ubiquinone/menaquinone biosynthesis C-methylase UbiE
MNDEMVVAQPDILEAKLSKERVPEVYAQRARFYDVWGIFTESKAQKRSLEIANIQDGETILEVAVGTGLTFARVLKQNPSGWNDGVDVTAAMLAKAKEKAAQSGTTNFNLQLGDAYDLAFENGRFDILINNYMFDLLPKADFPQVLAEFRRVLKPNGRLLLVNMAKGRHWYNGLWEALYKRKETSMAGCRGVSMTTPLEANGFSIITHEYISQMTFPSEIILAEKL